MNSRQTEEMMTRQANKDMDEPDFIGDNSDDEHTEQRHGATANMPHNSESMHQIFDGFGEFAGEIFKAPASFVGGGISSQSLSRGIFFSSNVSCA